MELAAVVIVALGPWLALTMIVRAAIAAEVVIGPARVLRADEPREVREVREVEETPATLPPLPMPPANLGPARARVRRRDAGGDHEPTDLQE